MRRDVGAFVLVSSVSLRTTDRTMWISQSKVYMLCESPSGSYDVTEEFFLGHDRHGPIVKLLRRLTVTFKSNLNVSPSAFVVVTIGHFGYPTMNIIS
jgi:hypothetical protein